MFVYILLPGSRQLRLARLGERVLLESVFCKKPTFFINILYNSDPIREVYKNLADLEFLDFDIKI